MPQGSPQFHSSDVGQKGGIKSTNCSVNDLNIYGDIDGAFKTYVEDKELPKLSEIKALIPAHCFRPSLARSIFYVVQDFFFLSILYYGAFQTHGTPYYYIYLPIFWFFTGFFMWAIFVIGHDCGHGAFSRYKSVNYFFGHLLNSLVLLPFHPWRISHRKHHKNTGNYEKDEIFYPIPEFEYASMPAFTKLAYKDLYFLGCLSFPIYLLKGYGRSSLKGVSHFNPYSVLFTKEERTLVLESVFWWSVMFSFLTACGLKYGLLNVMIYYGIPFFIYCIWLLVVTFLHHTEPGTKWYNTKSWSYVRGNLECVDRVYGLLEYFHHNAGCHTIHHLFPAIPHYHSREATMAVKPVLGQLRRVETQSPWKQFPESLKAWQESHIIPDETDVFVLPKSGPKKVE